MDYHILVLDKKLKSVSVVFHILVPGTGTNNAGLTWRQAVVKEAGGADAIVSILPDITTQEESDMKAGVVIEKKETVRFSSINLTDAQRLQEIKNQFNEMTTEIVTKKQITLSFIGLEGDV